MLAQKVVLRTYYLTISCHPEDQGGYGSGLMQGYCRENGYLGVSGPRNVVVSLSALPPCLLGVWGCLQLRISPPLTALHPHPLWTRCHENPSEAGRHYHC